jgi:glyoxylase-like metal-dependent hydrolase (beta-lactamase superfamily II)
VENSGWPGALPRPGNQRLVRRESAAPWFEIYQVSAGTFALLEPRHYEEVISYLIIGAERAVLLDTGMGIGDIRAEVEKLTHLPVIVVNSHCHYDHIGDDYRFPEIWAFDNDAEVARIERGLTRAECARFLEPGSYLDLPPNFDPAAYEIRPAPVTRRLRHLENIDAGARTLTAHHTPGHSPGSLCLFDNRDGLLFTGDAFYPGMLYAHFVDSDFEVYLESLKHLVGTLGQVSHLCPAHNEAYVPNEALINALEAFERIAAGEVVPETRDGIRTYRFEGFGVTLPSSSSAA